MSNRRVPEADRSYFAAFLDLRDRPGMVVGGGPVAAQKAEALIRSGVKITVIAPELCARLSELVLVGAIRHEAKRFQPGDLVGAEIVISATDDPAVNEAVAAAARSLRIPVNVADNAKLSSFIMPSVIDRSPIQIAISSGGNSPVLARKIRTILETLVPHAFGRLAALAGRYRARSKERLPDPEARRRFWEEVMEGPVAEMVLSGREEQAAVALERALDGASPADVPAGMVYLVGGGPGNPELLTLRALRVLQMANVVLYDHLVSPGIVDLCRREAERVYVGKESSNHALPQQDINALMVRLAREGKRVLRLKGGDPFVFGRGGEEIETLAAHGIAFEVVPGITAACGVSAYAGIPLTHRDHAEKVTFVTGHLKDGTLNLDWPALVRPRQTVVIYMGVQGLPALCESLVKHGLPATHPAAIVEKGTRPGQRVFTATLGTLAEVAAREKVRPPALVIVGEVVRLRDRLGWYAPGAIEAPEAAKA